MKLDERDVAIEEDYHGRVRAIHMPSGVQAECGDFKSPMRNRKEALARLEKAVSDFGGMPG